MNRLYQCIEAKRVNQSQARESIYRVLKEAEDQCLSVGEIMERLCNVHPKKISLNTVYRHLNLFVSCKLAVMLQDDFKKAYYCLTGEDPLVFIVCRKCNGIEKCVDNPVKLMSELESTDFVTVHKKCRKCR
jgi:Fe2+ or Zn2+ uptake regulation protein